MHSSPKSGWLQTALHSRFVKYVNFFGLKCQYSHNDSKQYCKTVCSASREERTEDIHRYIYIAIYFVHFIFLYHLMVDCKSMLHEVFSPSRLNALFVQRWTKCYIHYNTNRNGYRKGVLLTTILNHQFMLPISLSGFTMLEHIQFKRRAFKYSYKTYNKWSYS